MDVTSRGLGQAPLVRQPRSALVALYPLVLLALQVVNLVAPQRNGLLALTQIFAPHLFFPLLGLVPLAVRRRQFVLRALLSSCLLVGLLRFAPSISLALPSHDAAAKTLDVMTWNVLFSNQDVPGIVGLLRSAPARIVALQELTPAMIAQIEHDAVIRERYPHQLLMPNGDGLGMGLLSVYPILGHGRLAEPAVLWARFEPDGAALTVVNAHPILIEPRPTHFDATNRDHGIRAVRKLIAPMLARDERLLLVGDFNVTDREPAYRDLTDGLQDAFRLSGSGIGTTWRLEQWKRLPVGLLRIDYLFSTPDIRPQHTTVDCTPRGSDHCILRAQLLLRPAAAR